MSRDFIHCHQCLTIDVQKLVFCLTQCSRIYCKPCVQKVGDQCPNCRPAVCQVLPLVGDVSQDVRMVFKDINQLLKQLAIVVRFQSNQSMNLIRGLNAKNKRLEMESTGLKRTVSKLEAECRALRLEMRQLKERIDGPNSGIDDQFQRRKPDFHRLFAGLRNETQTPFILRSIFTDTDTNSTANDSPLFPSPRDDQSVRSTSTRSATARSTSGSLLGRFNTMSVSRMTVSSTNSTAMASPAASVRSLASGRSVGSSSTFTQTPHSLLNYIQGQKAQPLTTQRVIQKVNPFNRLQ